MTLPPSSDSRPPADRLAAPPAQRPAAVDDGAASPAWEAAYVASAPRLIRLATVLVGAADAHDLVVDAVQRAVHSPQWSAVAEPHAYLVRSVVNAASSQRRSDTRRWARERTAAAGAPGRNADGAAPTLDPGDLLDVRRALAALSPQQRAVVFLAYWEDRSIADIATSLDVSEGTVRRQLDRAKNRLRAVLRPEVTR